MWKQFSGRTPVVRRLILDSPDSDKQPQTADQERTMPNMPTTPPPEGPPPGWVPQQQPYQPPPGWVVPPEHRAPGDWWYDGHKWRPPVGKQPTRWELISQVPGMLIKLVFLVILLVIIGTLLFAH